MFLKICFSLLCFSMCLEFGHGEMSACYRDYTKRGCYAGNKNILPDLLDSKRLEIDWNDFEGFLHKLACHCASLAKKKGYSLFGIRFWGECYGGNNIDKFEKFAYREKIPMEHCVSHEYGECSHNDGRECSGTGKGEYVYEIKLRAEETVNGGFGNWSEWSECSTTCGEGRKVRERLCNNPEPSGSEGKDCSSLGDYSETARCVMPACPVLPCSFVRGDGEGDSEIDIGVQDSIGACINKCVHLRKNDKQINGVTIPASTLNNGIVKHCICERKMEGPDSSLNWKTCKIDLSKEVVNGSFSRWASWSECSKTCGGGVQQRQRTCTNPKPRNGGLDCIGSKTSSRRCNAISCPVNGGYSEWSEWSSCTKTCGTGYQQTSRKCNNPKPNAGGKDCSHLGPKQMSRQCNLLKCPVNGGFSKWSSWGKCSKTCGGGIEQKHRTCTNPTPRYGGLDCVGSKISSRSCNTFTCPVDGGYGPWFKWSSCTKTCSTGYQQRFRLCNNPTPIAGGKDCSHLGPNQTSRKCNTKQCPVDGGLTKWSEWSACTHTCGKGLKKRERKCTNPSPKYGGKSCTGQLEYFATCNNGDCLALKCTFHTGDGIGGTEKHIGYFKTKAQCIDECIRRKRYGSPAINGVTYSYNDGRINCYCEYGMRKRNTNSHWKSCFL